VRKPNEPRDTPDTERFQISPISGTRTWKFRCVDCGASWDVSTEMILRGDDWMRCPQCDGHNSTDSDDDSDEQS
jgi:DNA-directed RNA polymerase subunit RPC12/RpoP